MSNIEKELEIILTSKYCNIILGLLCFHKSLSINKTMFFAYLIRKNNYVYRNIYHGSTKNDIVLKCISMANGQFNDYCQNIKFIVSAINLLVKNSKIELQNGELFCLSNISVEYRKNLFIDNAIIASKGISERQFMKEVLKNV